jgi:hypothetical protein
MHVETPPPLSCPLHSVNGQSLLLCCYTYLVLDHTGIAYRSAASSDIYFVYRQHVTKSLPSRVPSVLSKVQG